ncbi:MAG: polysaccharide deacetylase family protein [Verrucomicrobia bacterium]|nr:polysaccharide deacetylase family protein [Verrucomicrobiota bacterium]
MILFLTYHRVCADAKFAQDREFYAVSRSTLAQHLRDLIAAGMSPLDLSTLSTSADQTSRRCYLSFDDGTQDHCESVLPLLQEFNLRAVFFVPTAKLDQPGRLTRSQLRELADAGQTIGCHSHEHKRMDTMSAGEIRRQFDTSQKILRQETGAAPWIFAPPGGFINSAVCAAALDSGLRVIRTMRWGFNRQPDLTALETVPLNRHTTDRQFQKILAGRQSRFLYLGKQAAKALVPARAYERLRALAFRAARTN